MPDDVTPAPSAPVADSPNPAPTPPAASTPSEADVTVALDSLGELSAEQMMAIEAGDFSSLAPAETPKTDPKPEPEPKPEGGDKPKNDPANIHRLSLGGMPPEARAKLVQFTTLVKSGMSEAQASAQVYGAPAATPDQEPEPPAAPEVPESVQRIEDAIKAKQAEIARVKTEYGDTTGLLDELQDLKLDLRDARREHASVAATQVSFQADVKKSLDKVMADHSDLWTDVKPGQEKSSFESFCDDEFFLAERKNDPVLERPDWPEHIAKRVLEKFFNGRGANSADQEGDTPQIPPLPNQSVRLPGSLTGNPDAPGVFTPGNIEAQFDTLTDDQQLEVLKRSGS